MSGCLTEKTAKSLISAERREVFGWHFRGRVGQPSFELADRLFDACPCLVECFRKEGGHILGVGFDTGLPDIFRVGARRRGLIWNRSLCHRVRRADGCDPSNSTSCDLDHVDRRWAGADCRVAGRAGSLWGRQAPALAAKSARISMTDKVVDFQSRLAAREVEYAEYDKRMQHLGALLEMMGPVISKMRELGADERAIARALRVFVEELEALEPRRPAG